MRRSRRWFLLLSVLVLIGSGLMAGQAMLSHSRPNQDLRPTAGKLPACPETPNCVSTQATRADQKMEPIRVSGDPDLAFQRMVKLIQEQPRTRLVEQTADYAHFAFTTLVFRFVDDVQLLLDRDQGVIHFRSASRVGHSDLGTNRRRMTMLVKKFESLPSE
ncbi:MAG: DUF1499 domain-containing protein [Planctomycetota bacterium]